MVRAEDAPPYLYACPVCWWPADELAAGQSDNRSCAGVGRDGRVLPHTGGAVDPGTDDDRCIGSDALPLAVPYFLAALLADHAEPEPQPDA